MNQTARKHPQCREDLVDLGYEVGGNCFQIHAAQIIHEPAGTKLVHGEVSHADYPEIRYAHCWLELEVAIPSGRTLIMVKDISNGHNVLIPQEIYYCAGGIVDEPGQLIRYSLVEATMQLIQEKNWGPWALDTNF